MSTIQLIVAQRISSENGLAAVVLQRWLRGSAARRRIWRFGGEGTVRAAGRIQKVWRGHKGRLAALEKWREYLDARAWVLCGFFRIMQAKRERRNLRILLWNAAATKVQALWKQRVTRRLYLVLRHRYRMGMALRIQQRVRMYQASSAASYLREHCPFWQAQINQRINQYVSGELPANIAWINAQTQPEEMVRAALLWLVGPGKLDLATQIAEACTRGFPQYLRGWCALFVCYCCNWTCRDRAGLVDEDMLHKAITVLRHICTKCTDALNEHEANRDVNPRVVAFGPSEQACATLFQYEEQVYFAAGVLLHRGGGRSLMAHGACQILRMHITSTFHSTPSHYRTRIPKIFERYLERTHGWARVGAQLQVDVLDVFTQAHVVVTSVTRDFPSSKGSATRDSANLQNSQPLPSSSTLMLYDEASSRLLPNVVEEPLAGIASDCYTSPRCRVLLSVAQAGATLLISGQVVLDPSSGAKCIPADSITPLVLSTDDAVKLYTMGRDWLTHLGREPYEVIAQKPRQDVIADFALHKLRLVSGASDTAARPRLKAMLPLLHYARHKRNLRREEDFACRILQKAFRGFVGRALWRRLQFPLMERSRQLKRLQDHRDRLKRYRDLRTNSAKVIQRMIRQKLHREFLIRGHRAAIIVQALFRGYRARIFRAQEELRRRVGPMVECVLKRGVAISGVPLHLSVHRCGLNYKFTGLAADGGTYQGICYSEQVGELVQSFNQEHPQSAPIRPWQQERICKLLVKNLAIVADISIPTHDLAKQNSSKVIVVQQGAHGRSVLDYRGQKRILGDQRGFYDKYEKRMRARIQASSSSVACRSAVDVLFTARSNGSSTTATKRAASTLENYRKYVECTKDD